MLNIGTKAQDSDGAQFERAREQSVTQSPHANVNGISTWSALQSQAGPILPPWGSRQREYALRLWDRHEYNTLWQGAAAGLIKRWCATPWVIDGGKILANRFQRVFRNAVSNEWVGWDSWLASVSRDFLRFDGGAWIEVVGPGDPRSELIGGVTGLNHLDSYATFPTGDPEYPCVYFSRLGKYNLMHRSRVIHIVDMPDGDELNPGYGLCALSRTIAVVERQLYEQRYTAINLNDVPSSGVVIAQNVTPEQVQQAYNVMQQRVQNDEPGQPGNVLWINSMNPQFPADLRNFTFSRPPEKYDWDTYVRIDVNMMALAIGEDPQDLWPLSSSAMGSGMQSEVLAKKARGKTFGQFLKVLERELNSILPESLEFSFKIVDPDVAEKEATIAAAWANAINAAGSRLSQDEGRRVLADQVEAFEAVMLDESGEMVELPDTDIRPVNAPLLAANTDPALPSTEQQAPVTADDNTPTSAAQKDFDATSAQFVKALEAIVTAAEDNSLSRYRTRILIRQLLNQEGLKARRDGLATGGVEKLSERDKAAHALWLAEQSLFIGGFLNTVFGARLSPAEINQHAAMWSNKSLQLAYFEGIESGDKDGMFEFFGDDGVESCKDCRRLQGTKMRMSEWASTRQRPGVDTDAYECGGWNCKHGLRRVET